MTSNLSTSVAERLLARSGKSLAELPSNSKIGRVHKQYGVRAESEYERIRALPERVWEDDPGLAELVQALNDAYKTPNGTWMLKPHQAVILAELHDYAGTMGVTRVGSGKTLVGALAPVVVKAQRPLFMAPAKLIGTYKRDGTCTKLGKTEKEFRKLAEQYNICRTYNFLSYEKVSNVKYYEGILDRLAPDFICFEEGHNLANPRSVRWRVIKAYLKKHPECILLDLTGTWQRNSVKNGAHICEYVMKERSPYPRSYSALEEWSQALDEDVKVRMAPGILTSFSDKTNPTLDDVRAGIGKRVTRTPGFVVVQGSDCDATLSLQGQPYNKYKPEVDLYFERLREHYETPDGLSFNEPIQLHEYLRQCQTEFYYYLDPQPPDEWRQCKRAWGQFSRDILAHNNLGLMSDWHVSNACAQGRIKHNGLWDKWKAIKPTYDPEKNKHTRWFGTSVLEHCAAWLEDNKGILFTPYRAFGQALKELTGLPYFANKGIDKDFGSIDDYSKGPCIASIQANKEGRNIQGFYSNAMIVGGIGSGSLMEQLLGRLHRFGQPAPEVTYDVFFGCIEALSEYHKARREAGYARTMNDDQHHKMNILDFLLPSEEEAALWAGARWNKSD